MRNYISRTDWRMLALDPPAVVGPSDTNDQIGVIEVVGTRPDQVQKIDRRTYRVKDNPHSAQADSIQLLRGLPAVTVTPNDQIQLLGAGGVTVMVDDRAIQGDVTQYLKTLHGRDIERIEVITNPSAQYSPEGTGGIINIVLRKKKSDGWSGSASAEAWTPGAATAGVTSKYKSGKWTAELQAQASGGPSGISRYHKLRSTEEVAGGPETINTEDGRSRSNQDWNYLNTKLTYDVDTRTSLSVVGFNGAFSQVQRKSVDYAGLTPDFESFDTHERTRIRGGFRGLELWFDHKGKKDGETLKASARLFGNPAVKADSNFESDLGDFANRRRDRLRFTNVQIDWQHPIGTKQILSLGGMASQENSDRKYAFDNIDGDPSLGPDFAGQFKAQVDTITGYATFQQQLGTWKVMPGLRMEHFRRKITSPGLPNASISRTQIYPSFHLDHPLSSRLDLTLSYSKRIDRPPTDDLRPYAIVTDPTTITLGNPALRDQTVDSYELNLHYHRKSFDVGIIIYDRETRGLWNSAYTVNAEGMNVVQRINAGHKSDRGAEFDVSTPIMKRIKAMASVNLFYSRVPLDPLLGRATFSSLRSTGNATLEWDGPERSDGIPGDIAQVQLFYSSASRDFQTRDEANYSLNLSYTRSFSRTLSLTGSIMSLGTRNYRHILDAPLVQEDAVYRQTQPVFKLKLSKTFGGSKPTNSAPISPPLPTTGG